MEEVLQIQQEILNEIKSIKKILKSNVSDGGKNINRGWLTINETSKYLGVSIRGVRYALTLKRIGLKNQDLQIKKFGNRTLISKKSIDELDLIATK